VNAGLELTGRGDPATKVGVVVGQQPRAERAAPTDVRQIRTDDAIGARAAHLQPTAVLSPALGGIVIGQETGRALGVRALFAERLDGVLMLRRGFTLGAADRVLVVEDVITTGGSTRETARVAEAAGAQVVGAAAIIDRGADHAGLGMVLQALVRLDVPTWQPEECQLCRQGEPVTKPGSRGEAGLGSSGS